MIYYTIYILAAAFLWAVEGVVLTPRLFNLDVGFVVFMIHIVPFVILTPFLWKTLKKLKKFKAEDYSNILLIALLGGALGTISLVKALFLVNFEQLSVVVLLQQLQPIFAILLATLLLGERAGKRFYIWAALAFVSGYFLVFGWNAPNFHTGNNTLMASLLALFAAFSWGSATVFGRRMALKHDFKTITYLRMGFTSGIMLMYIILFNKWGQFSLTTTVNWQIFGTIGISSGIIAMFMYYQGLNHVKAIRATICELFMPVSAVLLDYLINGSRLSWVQIIAALVMIGAITRITLMRIGETKQKGMMKSRVKEIDTMGGQAVLNGVMMRSNTHYGVAVRKPDGKITIMTEKLTSITHKHTWLKKPFIRGIIYLFEMLVIGMKALSWSAQQSGEEDEEPLTKKEIAFTIIASLGLAVALFIVVPFVLTGFMTDNKGIWFNLIDGVIRMTIFVVYLLVISYMKDVKTLFQYHGAEHKTVYCYEDGKPLTPKNIQKYSTKHSRCGTSFIIIVLMASILVYSFVVTDSWTIRLVSRILLLPVIAGASFEFLKFSARHVEHPLIRPFVYPGILIQYITTKEPDDDQVLVAVASLKAVLKKSGRKA